MCELCCAGLEISNESLQGVCEIEVLQHVNSGPWRCEILGLEKVSFGLLKPLYPGGNWLSGQNTVQREIESIKCKGNNLRGKQRNGD